MSNTNKPVDPKTEHEFHEQLNGRAAMQRRQEEERARLVAKAEQVSIETRKAKKRRKATRRFVVRAVVTVVLCAGLWLAQVFGLMAWQLAVPVMASTLAWLAFWVGAWVQYMWPKGGLFDGGNE